MSKKNTNVIPARYQESSIRFREAWLEYIDKEELVKFEIVNMVKILESDGYSRTHAIQKIVEDHNDLKGFSRRTIYRELPDEMKQDHSLRDLKQYQQQDENENDEDVINKPLDVPNDTNESINIPTAYEVKNAETVGEAVDEVYNSVDDYEQEVNEPHDQQYEEVIYDPGYVKSLEQRILELENSYDTPYSLEGKDTDLPIIIHSIPGKKDAWAEFDETKIKKMGLKKKR